MGVRWLCLLLLTSAIQRGSSKAIAADEPGLRELAPAGYCSDWAYPSTGDRTGGYDSLSTTASECHDRCQDVLPGTTSFYLKGTQCGCSQTTSGDCTVTPNAGYTSYSTAPGQHQLCGAGDVGTICTGTANPYISNNSTYCAMNPCTSSDSLDCGCTARAPCDVAACGTAFHLNEDNTTSRYCTSDTCASERDQAICCLDSLDHLTLEQPVAAAAIVDLPAVESNAQKVNETIQAIGEENGKMSTDKITYDQDIADSYGIMEQKQTDSESSQEKMLILKVNLINSFKSIWDDISTKWQVAKAMANKAVANADRWKNGLDFTAAVAKVVAGGNQRNDDDKNDFLDESRKSDGKLREQTSKVDSKLLKADVVLAGQDSRLTSAADSYLKLSVAHADDSVEHSSAAQANQEDDAANLVSAETAILDASTAAKTALQNIPIDDTEDLDHAAIDTSAESSKEEITQVESASIQAVQDLNAQVVLDSEATYQSIGSSAENSETQIEHLFTTVSTEDIEAIDVVQKDLSEGVTQAMIDLTAGAALKQSESVFTGTSDFTGKTNTELATESAALQQNEDEMVNEIAAKKVVMEEGINDVDFNLQANVDANMTEVDNIIKGFTGSAKNDAEAAIVDLKNLVVEATTTVHSPAVAVKKLMTLAEGEASLAAEKYQGGIGIVDGAKKNATKLKAATSKAMIDFNTAMLTSVSAAKMASQTQLMNLTTKAKQVKEGLRDGPIWEDLDGILRTIKGDTKEEEDVQSQGMQVLAGKLDSIKKHAAKAREGGLHITIPRLARTTNASLDLSDAALDDVNWGISKTEKDTKRALDQSIQQTQTWLAQSSAALSMNVKGDVRAKGKEIATEVANAMREIKNTEAEESANKVEYTAGLQFLGDRATAVEDESHELGSEVEKNNKAFIDLGINLGTSQIAVLKTDATAATQQATTNIDSERARLQAEVKSQLEDQALKLHNELDNKGNLTSGKINVIVDDLTSELDTLRTANENMDGRTANATGEISVAAAAAESVAGEFVSHLETEADTAQSSADSLKLRVNGVLDELNVEKTDLWSTLSDDVENEINATSDEAAAARANARNATQLELDSLHGGNVDADAALLGLKNEIDGVQLLERNLENRGALERDELERGLAGVGDEVDGALSELDARELRDRGIWDDLAQEAANKLSDGEQQDEALLNQLSAEEAALAASRDAAASQLTDRVDAEAKALHAANSAAFADFDAHLRGAANGLNGDGIVNEEHHFAKEIQGLEEHVAKFTIDSEASVKTFNNAVQSEKQFLDMNIGQIGEFSLEMQKESMKTIEGTIQAIHDRASALGTEFSAAEMNGMRMQSKMEELMATEEFQMLTKVMSADEFAHKATADGEDVLQYFETHEEASKPWMGGVLKTLEDEYAKQSGEQGTAGARSGADLANLRNDASNLENKLVGEIAGSAGHLPFEEMKGALNGLGKPSGFNMDDDLAHLAAATGAAGEDRANDAAARAAATQAQTDGAAGNVNGFADQLTDILAADGDLAAKEKAKLNEKSNSIANAVFYGGNVYGGNVATDPKEEPESLLQTESPALKDLLKQNAMLVKLHGALDHRHTKLGTEVHAIATQLREHTA